MATRAKANKTAARRQDELKAILEGRLRELTSAMQTRIRDVRGREGRERESIDEQEGSPSDRQEDVELALIEMKAETVAAIKAALRRLGQGLYGDCSECRQEIAKERLRALPFAVRCTRCEENREAARREKTAARSQDYGRLDA